MKRILIIPATVLLMCNSCEEPLMEETGNETDFKDQITNSQSMAPGHDIPETGQTVDLGLSVKWATRNIGSEDMYDGENSFFAWGETMTKDSFTWENYVHGKSRDLKKYSWGIYGSADDIKPGGTLCKEDDAAYINWGEHWRIPTETEFKELINNCTWIKDPATMTLIGTGPNGNTIVFPALGYMIDDRMNCADQISSVAYWTSTISRYDPAFAYQAVMRITDSAEPSEEKGFEIKMNSQGAGQNRAFGYYIRAVYVK